MRNRRVSWSMLSLVRFYLFVRFPHLIGRPSMAKAVRTYSLSSVAVILSLVCVASLVAETTRAQTPPREPQGYTETPMLPGQAWRVHDKFRPRPSIVKPADEIGQPPADAVVLFDGKNLDAWAVGQKDGAFIPAPWKVENGYMEIAPGKGSIFTRQKFGDCQLHIEFATPTKVEGSGQGRGNSGVIIMGRYEIQVLDSYDNDTYADGQASAIYGQYPPQVNVARGPGQWQSYDIIWEAPRFQGDKLVKPAKATVFHNGVLVHHARELIGPMAHQETHPYTPHEPVGPLLLQDHGNQTRFRNIWYRPLRNDDEQWLSLPGSEGVGKGKNVVLIAGDEEYRSEEALPQLAKILSKHHGFNCTVLFPINPDSGIIDPNYSSNIPGLHHLDKADLMIIATRFRNLPDWQMAYIDNYLKAGKPVIGLRTATHAFNIPGNAKYAKYSWNNKEWVGGFGQQVLGDTWISHHGNHGSESTRGVIHDPLKDHPVLRGVKDVWGPTDVYGIVHLPENSKVLLQGQILKGMKPTDAAVEDKRNSPMMPLAWVRSYKSESGAEGRVFCTTMGASIDLESEGLRRLITNASIWCVGLEDKIKGDENVAIVGEFKPTFFGFRNDPKFWPEKNLHPADFGK